jgi:hypothetical protein
LRLYVNYLFSLFTGMATKLIFILALFVAFTSCENSRQNNQTSYTDTDTLAQKDMANTSNFKYEVFEINSDSIYGDKVLSIRLVPLDTNKVDGPEGKYIFLLFNQQNEGLSEIYRDTIESTAPGVEFSDFNNDNIKDILIQNYSDVRSNWTYNLYVVNKEFDQVQKIKGFDRIKNPNYLPKYDLIDNMVMSGRNWTCFYKIVGDSIKDFGIIIYDSPDENGNYTYDEEYKMAIRKILKKGA